MSEFPSFIEPKWKTGALLLSDGSLFTGYSFGAESDGISSGVVGELVFNTAMSGYQEILTDPSYCDQIVLMTYPLIGNYGMNAEDVESRASFLKGVVVLSILNFIPIIVQMSPCRIIWYAKIFLLFVASIRGQ